MSKAIEYVAVGAASVVMLVGAMEFAERFAERFLTSAECVDDETCPVEGHLEPTAPPGQLVIEVLGTTALK